MKCKLAKVIVGLGSVAGAIGIGVLLGCSTPSQPSAATPGTAGKQAAAVDANAAQLWAQNCARCHNLRSPGAYSDAQWDVAMLHMRVRGNLTANEHKAILAFLKSAH